MELPVAALDLEWFDQTNGEHLTEIGLAIVRGEGTPFEHRSFVIREHAIPKYESKIAPRSSTGFLFGTDEYISKKQIKSTLTAALANIPTLVLHNGSKDKLVLATNGVKLSGFPNLNIVDAGDLYSLKSGRKSQISLENLCKQLGIPTIGGAFHHAGNDAAFTLMAYMKLFTWDGTSAPTTPPPQQPRNKTSSESLRSQAPRGGPNTPHKSIQTPLDIPESAIPFLNGFRDSLLGISSAVRVSDLATVESVKDCYRLYRDYCRQLGTSPNRYAIEFEVRYHVPPVPPSESCIAFGAPATAILHLTRQNVLQKYGKPRTKIAFLSSAPGDDLGTVSRYPNRINISELQAVVNNAAPRIIDDGTVGLFSLGEEYQVTFELHNGYKFPRKLVEILAEEDLNSAQLSFSLATGSSARNTILPPNSSFNITLTLTTKFTGYFTRRVVILVDNFRVHRLIRFRVVTDAENPNLEFPTVSSPYKPRRIVVDVSTVEAIPGESPPRPDFETFKYHLPRYDVSKSAKSLFDLHKSQPRHQALEKMPPRIKTFVLEKYSAQNFSRRFHSMLYLEECQMLEDIRDYDQLGEVLTPFGAFLRLQVPGLAENRPSVLYNDRIIIKLENGQRYEGFVHKVELTAVLLKFDRNFHNRVYMKGMKVDVQFNFARTCMKRSHRGLDLLGFLNSRISCWTFPSDMGVSQTEIVKRRQFEMKISKLINDDTLNEFQLKAMSQIVSKTDSQTPFIIFGPPGTGKTKTLVETVKVLLATNPASRILIAAPSNAAVDLIVQRLSDQTPGGLPPSQMLRVNAFTRTKESVPHYIARYSKRDEAKGTYVIPNSQDDLKSYRVICATLYTASALQGMGAFDPVIAADGTVENWFSHIFVDEVGHATETEFWAGVSGAVSPLLACLKEADVPAEERSLFKRIAGPFTSRSGKPKLPQLVIVGDPKQLGPIVRSDLAETCGYSMSYLERLVESCSAYAKNDDAQDASSRYKYPHNIVQLVNNYRSHSAILELYSKTFYDGDLLCCATMDDRLSKLSWLPNQNQFPIVFHGISGKDEREGSSPSWFNLEEVQTVIDYLKSLLNGAPPPFKVQPSSASTSAKGGPKRGGMYDVLEHMEKSSSVGLRADDIGIITPYRKQIDKIRARLEKEGWNRIKVGTVEEFQGDEKKVILLSTVRSSAQWIERDQKFNIGFLRNPKRFNVSISRAKALMIVIGNPDILCGDENWNTLVRYCEKNGACVGYPIPIKKVGENDYRQLAEEDYASDEEGDERDVRGVGWRRDE
ncbi:P-loop containing nucleoside triphosphate hydrolase protein, partial [Obelidium mucronatum]